jgi:hypothetical protein
MGAGPTRGSDVVVEVLGAFTRALRDADLEKCED